MLTANLLPPSAVASLRRESWLRAVFAISGSLALVSLTGLILLLPSFVAVRLQGREIERTLALQESEAIRLGTPEKAKQFQDALKYAEKIVPFGKIPPLAPVLTKVFNHVSQGVTISQATLRPATRTVLLAGTAESRDEFLQFTEQLKQMPELGNVTYPVSSVVRERDISFTINLVLK